MTLITIMTLIIIIITGICQMKAFESWPKKILLDHSIKNYSNFVAEKLLKVALLVICFKCSIHGLRNQHYCSWSCHRQKQPSRSVLGKDVLKICSEFTGKHQYVFSYKFAAYFQNIFPKNTSGGLLLHRNIQDIFNSNYLF